MTEWIIQDRRTPEMVQHASTEGAVMAMQSLSQQREMRSILDVGCGSGLLSLAAATLWPIANVIASDISAGAVEDTTANIHHHEMQERIKPLRAKGFDHPKIRENAPYSLIIANLIAPLLIEYAGEIKKHLQSGGFVIISGILAWRYPLVEEAFSRLGFEVAEEITLKEWRTSTLQLK